MSDWDDIKNAYIVPARHNGKSQLQAEMYETLLKGDQNIIMDFNKFVHSIKPFSPPVIAVDQSIEEKVEQIDIPEPAPPQEEWVWVKGYKGTDANMRCRDYQYAFGRQFDIVGQEISLCDSGFHFCKKLGNVFKFYDVGNGNRFFEVEALVKKSAIDWSNKDRLHLTTFDPYSTYPYSNYPCRSFSGINEDKYTSKSIRFIRELTADEVFAEYPSHYATSDWTTEQKELAMRTSIKHVFQMSRISELIDYGYSEPFARYIAEDNKKYRIAVAVGSQQDLSMDVKVMSIFMNN